MSVVDLPGSLKSSGICKITDDILWYMFHDIADRQPLNVRRPDEEVSALQDIWRSCQVCTAWRNVILASPGLWGKLIDLSFMANAMQAMGEAVVSRSGTTPLWIYGAIGRTKSDEKLFFELLDTQFRRIEKIVITVHAAVQDSSMWSRISRPAPRLRRLQVRAKDTPQCESFDLDVSVRANKNISLGVAPLLQVLLLERFPWTPVNLPAWTIGLREIELGHCISQSELHALLSSTSVLEALCLRGPILKDSFPSSIVHLPLLRTLTLSGLLLTFIPILMWIRPAPGCPFVFRARHNGPISSEDLVVLRKFLGKLLHEYLVHNNIEHLTATMSNLDFIITDEILQVNRGGFHIDIYAFHENRRPQEFMLQEFLDICNPDYFSQIKHLSLISRRGNIGIHFQQPVRRFLQSFLKLDTLIMGEMTIELFLNLFENDACTFFPDIEKLEIYWLRANKLQSGYSICRGDTVLRYLFGRKQMGLLPALLEFSNLDPERVIYDFRLMEDLAGLQICCTTQKGIQKWYRCGDGSPEQLLF